MLPQIEKADVGKKAPDSIKCDSRFIKLVRFRYYKTVIYLDRPDNFIVIFMKTLHQ